MSLRRKACSACIRAKRRCDRGLPACRRCSRQSLTCEYLQNRSLRHTTAAQAVEGVADSLGFDDSRGLMPRDMHPTIADDAVAAVSDIPTYSTPSESLGLLSFENEGFPLGTLDDIPTETLVTFENSQRGMESLEESLSASEDMVSTWAPMLSIGTESGLLYPQPRPDHHEPYNNPGCRPHSSNQPSTTTMRYLRNCNIGSSSQPSTIEYAADIPRLRCVEQMWSRGQDTPRWEFCANEVLSFVHLFARTGSAPFLTPREPSSDAMRQGTPAPLLRAMGVCAAYVTADDTGRLIFEQLLEMEAKAIIDSTHSEYFGSDSIDSQLNQFRAELVRVQVMTIYHIICLFSPSRRMRLLAEKQEPLITSWTRQLLLRLQALENDSGLASSSASSSSTFPSSSPFSGSFSTENVQPFPTTNNNPPYPPQKAEVVSAYKTILMSHLVHTIYTSLTYQFCRHLPELRSIPILTSTLGKKTQYGGLLGPPLPPYMLGSRNFRPPKMTYIDYSDSWKEEELRCLDRRDRFTVLVLAACKGIGFLNADN